MALNEALRTKVPAWECTIVERHTTSKRDRPSATARELASFWYRTSGRAVADLAAIRGGLPLSDHEVILTSEEELLTIKHSVTDRRAAARGALLAGCWIVAQPPGFYQISDVFDSSPAEISVGAGNDQLEPFTINLSRPAYDAGKGSTPIP
jgi:4-hydroxy-tetrahydrodipicolinate reductase